jgi:UDP-N-acetylglucosamine 2-epimerase (non-hydrolysing)
MKVSPIIKVIQEKSKQGTNIQFRLVHTGQHYDKKMSADFFEQLNIPEPDNNLEAGGGTQAEQTAAIMLRFEKELIEHRPDIVLVVGDVTSTMACAITAKKLCIPVVHVEAGIRSGDMTMPEEVNRIVTDAICDHFYTTSEVANKHLRAAGVDDSRIHFVGNTMIDTLYQNINKLICPKCWTEFNLHIGDFFLMTLHRPANVDDVRNLDALIKAILDGTSNYPVVFPVHPRTREKLSMLNFDSIRLIQIDPLPYLEFIYLVKNARAVITDSGGITEETTVLNIPCLTLRNSTERPETVTLGTNELIGTNPDDLKPYLTKILNGEWKKGIVPPFWDGKTAERIVHSLIEIYMK